jgi:sensor c-di-GMP phosphodiesterase-like protein
LLQSNLTSADQGAAGGKVVVAPRLRKLAAIALGLALAGIPAAAVHVWLSSYIERQVAGELDVAARRVIALAETRLGAAVEALDDLTMRGVRSCAGADLGAMNETSFSVAPVKEVSVIAPGAETLCTNLAVPLGERRVISPPIATPYPNVIIEVLRIGDRADNVVRVRNLNGPDGAGLAVLVPADLLLPRTSSNGGPNLIRARIDTIGGALIGERGAERPETRDDADRIVAKVRSERFGILVTVSMPSARLFASHDGLVMIGTLGTGSAAALILAFAAFAAWRPHGNPIADLERAIENDEFVPYYQPIVDLTSARVVGAEVLIRWRRPDGTLVPPAAFIPLAESTGLIVPITRSLMRRVCAEAGAAIGARPHFSIGFNLAALHFNDETVVDDVRAIIGASPVALAQVLLEVTERQPLDNLTVARRVIAALQGLGVRVGIDDLGTGHSGLSYMLKLGVDFIKIDKLFVDAIDTERYSTTIIETLVELGRNMHMEIIAEGVETLEQVAHLRARGIRKAQGYVFAPPLPGASFLQLIEAADATAVPRAA